VNNAQPLLEDLRLFCVVVRKQSFAASALELGVSNALVSKRIAVLEKSLQVRLLHRTTRKVSLTDHGGVVHQWAQRILEDVDQLGEAISQKGSQDSGATASRRPSRRWRVNIPSWKCSLSCWTARST
jgi:LysR family transcriptional activator of dmlA